jgi:hypothetical protein
MDRVKEGLVLHLTWVHGPAAAWLLGTVPDAMQGGCPRFVDDLTQQAKPARFLATVRQGTSYALPGTSDALSPNRTWPSSMRRLMMSNLLEAAGSVLMQQARDQRLVRQTLGECALLDRLQVLAREPNVQPSVLPERCLGVAGVASSLALAAGGGFPLTALDGVEQLFLFGVNDAAM